MDTKKMMLKKNAGIDLRARQHVITQDRSQFLIDNFKKNRSRIINPELKKKDDEVGILPFSECFNAKAVRKLLDMPNCEGLRIYSGLNEDYQMVFVLRAVDENGKDICFDTQKPVQKPNAMMAMAFMAPPMDACNLDDAQRVPPWPENEQ